MLDTVRMYARQRLAESEEEDECRRRHAAVVARPYEEMRDLVDRFLCR